MEQIRSAGGTVGEYVGNGQGERECADADEETSETVLDVDIDDSHDCCDEVSENVDDSGHPLLFLYDCETTGLSIYTEHLTEIAAKVVSVPVSHLSQPSYSSLVKTSKHISKKGDVH